MRNFVKESAHGEISERTGEKLISVGEQLRMEAIAEIHRDDLFKLCRKLIEIYDAPFVARLELRRRAARVVAKIAGYDGGVLELVIENAKSYANQQHIDDAFPYSPNAFDVFAEIKPMYERVTSFLRQIVQHDWGVPSWSAAQTLQVLEEAARNTIIMTQESDRKHEGVLMG